MELKEGDVVRLKSGGPPMTVFKSIPAADAKERVVGTSMIDGGPIEVSPATPAVRAQVTVVWFTEAGEVRSGDLALYLLEGPLRRHAARAEDLSWQLVPEAT